MRVASPAPAAVSRSTESKSPVAARPTAEANGAAPAKRLPGHSPIDIGDFGSLVKKPADAKTRATQGEQLHDIADGVRDGSLTEKETQGLMEEQEAISNAQKEAMADGKLTGLERLKLAVMQSRADRNIEQARGNSSRDVFAPFDADARRQAGQIDQIADGRTNGNITNSEAGKLLDQQGSIAASRGNVGPLSNLLTDMKQDQAQKDIERHSKPGTQWDLKPLPKPFPLPFPRPEPKPLPLPFPRPEFPTKPEPLPFPRLING